MVTATERSAPATFPGFFDEIRRRMAQENGVNAVLFSFNSKGACPACSIPITAKYPRKSLSLHEA